MTKHTLPANQITTTLTLQRYLSAPVGRDNTGLLEVRARNQHGMTRAFYDPDRLQVAAAEILRAGQRTDVYVGCAPRQQRSGARDAIGLVWVLWVDCATRSPLTRAPAQTRTDRSDSQRRRPKKRLCERS